MKEGNFRLSDGRNLSYAAFGDAGGWPVVYFHGTPSSRLELTQLAAFGTDAEAAIRQNGLYLIAIDRPGMGLSTFNPAGTVRSCAADVVALLQSMGIGRFATLSWSGGGPFALALGHDFPDLVHNIQIFCGFTRPFDSEVVQHMRSNKWYFRAARYTPAILRGMMNVTSRLKLHKPPPKFLTSLPSVDYALFGNPKHYKEMTATSIKEACRQGARGPVYEAALYFQDFGFQLSDIQQPVHYWWGYEDTMVIRLHQEAIDREVPKGRVFLHPGEGHLSVFVKYYTQALELIAKTKPAP